LSADDRELAAGSLVELAWASNTARVAGHVPLRRVADTIAAARDVGVDEDAIRSALRLGQSLAYDDQGVRLDEEIAIAEAGEIVDRVADSDACGPFDPLRTRAFKNGATYRLWCIRHADHSVGLHATEWRPSAGVPIEPGKYDDEPERDVEVGI
jgi:hypothetical protein